MSMPYQNKTASLNEAVLFLGPRPEGRPGARLGGQYIYEKGGCINPKFSGAFQSRFSRASFLGGGISFSYIYPTEPDYSLQKKRRLVYKRTGTLVMVVFNGNLAAASKRDIANKALVPFRQKCHCLVKPTDRQQFVPGNGEFSIQLSIYGPKFVSLRLFSQG